MRIYRLILMMVIALVFSGFMPVFAQKPYLSAYEDTMYIGEFTLLKNTMATDYDYIDNNPWPGLVSDWQNEVYISDTTGSYYHGAIIASDSLLHVFGQNHAVIPWSANHFISSDNGLTWEFFADYYDSTMTTSVGAVKAHCDNHIVYTVWKGRHNSAYNTFINFRASNDHGLTWPIVAELVERPEHWMGARYGNVTGDNNTVFVSFVEDSITCWRSFNRGQDWASPGYLADRGAIGYPPSIIYKSEVIHLLYNSTYYGEDTTLDVFYINSHDQGETWSEPEILSFPQEQHGQWPEVDADEFGNVAICWMDYLGSPYAWTGGIWCRISNDYGQTWNEPVRLDNDYKGRPGNDVVINSDYVTVVWPGTAIDQYLYYRESYDCGQTWGDIQVISQGINSVPDLCKYDDYIHLAWVKQEPDRYYLKYRQNDNMTHIDNRCIPSSVSELHSYPNPFNSSTVISYSNIEVRTDLGGGEIEIYDICGRLLGTLNAGGGQEGKVTWDATDASGEKVCSGIYFARVRTSSGHQTAKIIYLR